MPESNPIVSPMDAGQACSSHRSRGGNSRSSHHSHNIRRSSEKSSSSSSISSGSSSSSVRKLRRAQMQAELEAQLALQAAYKDLFMLEKVILEKEMKKNALKRREEEKARKRREEEAKRRQEEDAYAKLKVIEMKMEQAESRWKREEERAEARLHKAILVHRQNAYNAQLMQRKRHEVDLVALEAEPVESCDSSHEYRLNLSPPNQIDVSRMGSSAHLQQTARDLAPMNPTTAGRLDTMAFQPLLLSEPTKLPQPEFSATPRRGEPLNVSSNPFLPATPQVKPTYQQTDVKQEDSPSMGPVLPRMRASPRMTFTMERPLWIW